MKNIIKAMWNWLVKSSADPAKVSLTVKGILTGAIPAIIFIAPSLGLPINSENIGSVTDLISAVVQYILGVIASLVTIYGLFRKIKNTLVVKPQ